MVFEPILSTVAGGRLMQSLIAWFLFWYIIQEFGAAMRRSPPFSLVFLFAFSSSLRVWLEHWFNLVHLWTCGSASGHLSGCFRWWRLGEWPAGIEGTMSWLVRLVRPLNGWNQGAKGTSRNIRGWSCTTCLSNLGEVSFWQIEQYVYLFIYIYMCLVYIYIHMYIYRSVWDTSIIL